MRPYGIQYFCGIFVVVLLDDLNCLFCFCSIFSKFTEELFEEMMEMINWSDNRNHDIILENIYFNRSTISALSLKFVPDFL